MPTGDIRKRQATELAARTGINYTAALKVLAAYPNLADPTSAPVTAPSEDERYAAYRETIPLTYCRIYAKLPKGATGVHRERIVEILERLYRDFEVTSYSPETGEVTLYRKDMGDHDRCTTMNTNPVNAIVALGGLGEPNSRARFAPYRVTAPRDCGRLNVNLPAQMRVRHRGQINDILCGIYEGFKVASVDVANHTATMRRIHPTGYGDRTIGIEAGRLVLKLGGVADILPNAVGLPVFKQGMNSIGLLPLAETYDGTAICLDSGEHLAVIGGEGSGKTTVLQALVTAAIPGVEIYVCDKDANRRLIPDMRAVAKSSTPQETIRTMEYLKGRIDTRKEILREHNAEGYWDLPLGVKFDPVLLVIDDFDTLFSMAKPQQRDDANRLLHQIVGAGRWCGITVAVSGWTFTHTMARMHACKATRTLLLGPPDYTYEGDYASILKKKWVLGENPPKGRGVFLGVDDEVYQVQVFTPERKSS